MKRQVNIKTLLLIPALLAISQTASAEIQGLTGTSFNLTAKTGHISTGDGNSLLAWGYEETGWQKFDKDDLSTLSYQGSAVLGLLAPPYGRPGDAPA